MATEKLVIHIDDKETEIEVRTARKVDGLLRDELMQKVSLEKDKSEQWRMAAFFLYPTCIAGLVPDSKLRELHITDFMSRVDEPDLEAWYALVLKLNPQWLERNSQIFKTAVDAANQEMNKKVKKKTG